MNCLECGGDYEEKQGSLEVTDENIGPYSVSDVQYYQCTKCGDLLFSPETSKVLERKRSEVMDRLIKDKPVDSFVTGTEAACILGITRQAFHKHRRIHRGFIYQTDFGGKTVFLKESVHRFKETGDGRFPLVQFTEVGKRSDYVFESPLPQGEPIYIGDSSSASMTILATYSLHQRYSGRGDIHYG